MSVPISAIPNKSRPLPEANRNVTNFHPTIWGDYFLTCDSTLEDIDSLYHKAQLPKQELRKMLLASTDKPLENLKLIDNIQRLGIDYHFEIEIKQSLEEIYAAKLIENELNDDLQNLALAFRLLRQGGHNISSDIFNKFKEEKGHNFKKELVNDVEGLLSLYEASYLSVHGEKILDEALIFTRGKLASMASQSNCAAGLADRIRRALDRPLRKNINRLEARNFIAVYEQDEDRNEELLKLAKLDFDIVRKIHLQELSDLTKWWKELDFAKKLPFARDRLVECYFWPFGIFFEPPFGFCRKWLAKTACLISVIDDIYDAYGTLEELEVFTRVIVSFDASKKEELPGYMQECYQAILDFFSEMEEELVNQGRPGLIFYPKEQMKRVANAYLLEAKSLSQGTVPTTEEYWRNGLITSVYPVMVSISFCGMGEIASQAVFDWLHRDPKILRAPSAIGRFMNDIVSHKFEQSRGHTASAVECYMKQHNATEQEAYNQIYKIVDNAWKDINEELLEGTAPPIPLLKYLLNFARVIDVVYKDEDAYTNSKNGLNSKIATLMLHPLAT